MFSEGCIAGGLGDPKHEAFGRHVREIEVEADILRDLQYKIEEGWSKILPFASWGLTHQENIDAYEQSIYVAVSTTILMTDNDVHM